MQWCGGEAAIAMVWQRGGNCDGAVAMMVTATLWWRQHF